MTYVNTLMIYRYGIQIYDKYNIPCKHGKWLYLTI